MSMLMGFDVHRNNAWCCNRLVMKELLASLLALIVKKLTHVPLLSLFAATSFWRVPGTLLTSPPLSLHAPASSWRVPGTLVASSPLVSVRDSCVVLERCQVPLRLCSLQKPTVEDVS